jgi:hypothetical protein
MENLQLKFSNQIFSICRLTQDQPVPQWVFGSSWFSVTRTESELSIVVPTKEVPNPPSIENIESGWSMFSVLGPLDFSLTGILVSIAQPLAAAKISIFAISTFDTDSVLIKSDSAAKAREVLENSGFIVI